MSNCLLGAFCQPRSAGTWPHLSPERESQPASYLCFKTRLVENRNISPKWDFRDNALVGCMVKTLEALPNVSRAHGVSSFTSSDAFCQLSRLKPIRFQLGLSPPGFLGASVSISRFRPRARTSRLVHSSTNDSISVTP